jgi:hypothetical protein
LSVARTAEFKFSEEDFEPFANQMNSNEHRRLQHALSVIISAKAVLSLKDGTDCNHEDIVSTHGWSAYQVAAALRQQ